MNYRKFKMAYLVCIAEPNSVGLGPRWYISDQFLGDANVAGLRTTLSSKALA